MYWYIKKQPQNEEYPIVILCIGAVIGTKYNYTDTNKIHLTKDTLYLKRGNIWYLVIIKIVMMNSFDFCTKTPVLANNVWMTSMVINFVTKITGVEYITNTNI